MKIQKNQHGFSVIEALLIILILVILGAVGYVAYSRTQSNKPKNDTTQPSTTTENQPQQAQSEPQSDSLDVSQWGVKMTIPTQFKAMPQDRVMYSLTDSQDTLLFNSDLQANLLKSCAYSSQHKNGPWGIVREHAGHLKSPDGSTYTDKEADANSAYIHIGDYYYRRTYPMVGCDNAVNQVTNVDMAYAEMFNSLQAD